MTGVPNTDDLLRLLVTSLVEHVDDVSIARNDDPPNVAYEVSVHPDDVGKIIGRQGRIIKSIRTIVRAAASLGDGDASVEVLG